MGRAYSLLSAIIPHDEREILEVEREEDSEEEVEEPSEAELKIRERFGIRSQMCQKSIEGIEQRLRASSYDQKSCSQDRGRISRYCVETRN